MNELGLKILELRSKGFGCRKIAKEIKCSKATVSKYINMKDSGVSVEDHLNRLHRDKEKQSFANKIKNLEKSVSTGGTSESLYNKNLRGVMKELLVALLGGKCRVCNYNKCMPSLCFHHYNPAEKAFELRSKELIKRSYVSVLEEAKKCVLLCHNCHTEIHANVTLCPDLLPFWFEPPKEPLKWFNNRSSNILPDHIVLHMD